MSSPAVKPDRRRSPRSNLDGLAYINFEPDNGGIVLNVSQEGLSFHAVSPLQDTGPVAFSLFANGKRLDAKGVLAWTDRTRKTGGLQFTKLSPDARQVVGSWIWHSSNSFAPERAADSPLMPSERPASMSTRAPAAPVALLNVVSRWVRAAVRWTEFSRGLVVGLLIAVFVAAAFLFNAQRQQIGAMLIRIGEHFEAASAKSPPRNASSPAQSSTSAVPEPAAQNRAATARPAALAALSPASTAIRNKLPRLPASKAVPRSRPAAAPLATNTPAPAVPAPSAVSLPVASSAPGAASTPPQPAPSSQPTPAAPNVGSKIAAVKATDHSDADAANAEEVVEINSGVPLGRYFDVGKFKDQWAAGQIKGDLANLGFRAVVMPKSLLWMKSYQVLVGPYHNDEDAQGARQNLQTHGFKPHPLAKRSRHLTLVENFIVTWEAYSAHAAVKFVKGSETSGNAVGNWVKLSAPSNYTGIEYTANPNGKRNLLSIQFRGMRQAVALPNSADRGIVF